LSRRSRSGWYFDVTAAYLSVRLILYLFHRRKRPAVMSQSGLLDTQKLNQ